MRTMPVDEAVDLIRATVGTDQTTRTAPEVAIDSIAAELDDARARVTKLEADLLKIEGFRADLADRCLRQGVELDELRAAAKADR